MVSEFIFFGSRFGNTETTLLMREEVDGVGAALPTHAMKLHEWGTPIMGLNSGMGHPPPELRLDSRIGRPASAVGKICALTNLDDVAVRIADVAADLAVFGQRLGDELGSSAFP